MANKLGIPAANNFIPLTPGSTMRAGTILATYENVSAWPTVTTDSTTLYVKDGWAWANGASLSQSTFADLFAKIGTTGNTAVNPLTGSAQAAPSGGYFRLPNLQGTFLRGVGDFTDNTKDTTLGGFQADQMQGHSHYLENGQNIGVGGYILGGVPTTSGGAGGDSNRIGAPTVNGTNGTPRTGTESRPQNVGVYYIIKLYDNLAPVDVYVPSASASVPGIVDTGAQSFAGDKIFTGQIKDKTTRMMQSGSVAVSATSGPSGGYYYTRYTITFPHAFKSGTVPSVGCTLQVASFYPDIVGRTRIFMEANQSQNNTQVILTVASTTSGDGGTLFWNAIGDAP